MTTFAEKAVVYSDGQVNVTPLPEAIMANGFIPETRDAPGMPLAAQHLNWLFRDLYRQTNALKETSSHLETAVLPAWVPIPCPMENAPEGYLKCNGATFDKEKYPELAKGYPSGVLPDLRGEFIRGWDDGRGVDVGRGVLTTQLDEFKRHDHKYPVTTNVYTACTENFISVPGLNPILVGDTGPNDNGFVNFIFPEVQTGGNETRPRNIAFLYIVRAA